MLLSSKELPPLIASDTEEKAKKPMRPFSSKPYGSTREKLQVLGDARRSSLGKGERKGHIPGVTAKSWVIYDVTKRMVVASKKETVQRQVASLTKIMTFYTCLRLVEKYKMNPKTTLVTVSRTAASMPGTSANLREGDQLALHDLFYGLMLPSGNDAAYALAEYFGGLLQAMKPHRPGMLITATRLFIKEMNYNAMRLKLIHTQFDSSHGLPNKYNYSTA